jgi:hypothetical protein
MIKAALSFRYQTGDLFFMAVVLVKEIAIEYGQEY